MLTQPKLFKFIDENIRGRHKYFFFSISTKMLKLKNVFMLCHFLEYPCTQLSYIINKIHDDERSYCRTKCTECMEISEKKYFEWCLR